MATSRTRRPGRLEQPAAATPGFRASPGQAANSTFRPEFTTAADPAAQQAARRGTTTELDIGGAASHASPPPRTHDAPRKSALNAFKMEVARHLAMFEQAVAAEQADLRQRIIGANSEAAGLRADLRLLESERARRAEGEPHRTASAPPTPEHTAAPSHASSTSAVADASNTSPGDDDDVSEEEAAELMDMISAAQERVRASLARDRELVEALGSEMHAIRQQVTRLQAPM